MTLPKSTIAVNNACDLCNKRLLHAQPAPRNSMLRNRSASEHRRRTCVLGYAISGAAYTADVTCICACHCVTRPDTFRRHIYHFRSRRLTIHPITASDDIVNIACKEIQYSKNDIVIGHNELLLQLSRYVLQMYKLYVDRLECVKIN